MGEQSRRKIHLGGFPLCFTSFWFGVVVYLFFEIRSPVTQAILKFPNIWMLALNS